MIYLASLKASATLVVAVMFTLSKPLWRISSATPSGENTSYKHKFEVKPIIRAVCAMFEPIIPAAPTITNLSFVKNSILCFLYMIQLEVLYYAHKIKEKGSDLLIKKRNIFFLKQE